ncbi:hypothetical protein H1R20_g8167, partial [Candolleomyces eurysporus]
MDCSNSSTCDGLRVLDIPHDRVVQPPCKSGASPGLGSAIAQGLSPLTSARMPDHSSKVIVPRRIEEYHRQDTMDTLVPSTPSPTSKQASLLDYDPQPTEISPVGERFAWRIASGYFAYFLCGYGDGVTATILPYFNITFMTGSLFYAASTIGFLTGTLLLERILQALGKIDRSSTRSSWFPLMSPFFSRPSHTRYTSFSSLQARHLGVIISSFLHGMFFMIMGTRGGFPAIFMAYAVAAFARSILTGSLNEFFSIEPKHLGYGFSMWGLGSVVSPLVCQLVIAQGVPWYKFYLGSLVASALNVVFLTIAFRPTANEFIRERREVERERTLSLSPTPTVHEGEKGLGKKEPTSALRVALSLPFQWVISLLAGLYVASETTSQCFMVTYLLTMRDANPKTVGYVTSGFFGGITIGRLIWGYYTPRGNILYKLALLTLVMQFLIWFVRSVVVNSVALSAIGLLYGPLFPACLSVANDMLPQDIRMVSMALISSSASIGCAVFPFVTGIILNQKGVHTLPYVNVALSGALMCYWACLPTKKRNASKGAGSA